MQGNVLVGKAKMLVLGLAIAGCVTKWSTVAEEDFTRGQDYLALGDQKVHESHELIQQATGLRKEIAKKNFALRQTKEAASKDLLKAEVIAMRQKMRQLQESGAHARRHGAENKRRALDSLEKGMQARWQEYTTNTAPLVLASSPKGFIAHNPRVLSADPERFARQSATLAMNTAEQQQSDAQMTLRIQALADQNAPESIDVGTYQFSRDRKYLAHIEVESGDGQAKGVPLNEIHNWRLIVSDIEGNPVEDKIDIRGHMPGHVHGLPTKPEVTEMVAPGVYRVEGVKFQMRGWWVMEFLIDGDAVKFNMVL